MRTIAIGKEPIVSLWHTNADKTVRYRMIRFLIQTECEEGTLLLNTVTGELVLLTAEEERLLCELPRPYCSEMDELIARRFLVPEMFDEMKSVTQLRRVIRSLSYPGNEVVGYTILPTSACNARCFYCYESEYPRCSMSEETAKQLVDYIEAHCGEAKKIRLSWFGGEPTLGEKRIDDICESLRVKGISYTSSMISNGYLFTKAMAHKAKEDWQLRHIQITLDGTEEVYNSVKAYVNPTGSPYRRVIDNIGFLLDEKIRVSVRMNLDRHNAANLRDLIDELAQKFPKNKYFSVYVHEIFDGMGYDPIQRSDEELQQIIEELLAIEDYIEKKGFRRPTRKDIKVIPNLRVTYCMADNPSTILINPQGRLGKCQHMQYSYLVGDLQNGCDVDRDNLLHWTDYQIKEGCNKCPLSPACGVPKTCASGRSCLPAEMKQKLDAVRGLCCEALSTTMVEKRQEV